MRIDSLERRFAPFLQTLSRNHELTVYVRGECMAPELSNGTRVTVAGRRYYWPSDLVVHWNGSNGLGVHRLLGWSFRGQRIFAVTRGDSHPRSVRLVTMDDIIGRVTRSAAQELVIVRPAQRARVCLYFAWWIIHRTGGRLWRFLAKTSCYAPTCSRSRIAGKLGRRIGLADCRGPPLLRDGPVQKPGERNQGKICGCRI